MSVDIVHAQSAVQFDVAAQLHEAGITEGFLSTLGTSFLGSLYKGVAAADNSGVLVAVEASEVLGFISYSRDVKACYKSVLKSRWPTLTVAMIPNALKPSFYKMVFETLSYPKQHHGTDQQQASAPDMEELRPELLSMAVGENSRGKGVGKLLVAAVDTEMRCMDLPGYYVVTHAIDERSNGFYQGRGFVGIRQYQSHGKPMSEYYKELS